MANPVTWFEIIGSDSAALQKFYADVFAWKLSPPMAEMGNYSMLDHEGQGIQGGIGGEASTAPRQRLHPGRRPAGVPRQGRGQRRHHPHAGHPDHARHDDRHVHGPGRQHHGRAQGKLGPSAYRSSRERRALWRRLFACDACGYRNPRARRRRRHPLADVPQSRAYARNGFAVRDHIMQARLGQRPSRSGRQSMP